MAEMKMLCAVWMSYGSEGSYVTASQAKTTQHNSKL